IPKAAPTLEAWLAPHSASEETAEPQAAHQAYKAPPASFQVRDPAPAFAPQETPVQQADSSPKAWLDGATSQLPRKAPPGSLLSQAAAAFDLPKQAPAAFGLDAPVAMKAPPIPQEKLGTRSQAKPPPPSVPPPKKPPLSSQEATPPKQKMPPMPVSSPQEATPPKQKMPPMPVSSPQ
ncbi:unnamed protein product, partial [Symbiodinium sp. KB8]